MSEMNPPSGPAPQPAPSGGPMPPTDPGPVGGEPYPVDPMIRTMLLVSAIANCVFALLNLGLTFVACYPIVFVPALIVLAVFEFLFWNELSKPGDHRSKGNKLMILSICEIATILACNPVSLAAGIMNLINKPKFEGTAPAPAGTPPTGTPPTA